MKVVDFHAHAFPDSIAEKASQNLTEYYGIPLAADGHFSHIVDSMRQTGVDRMVIHATATKPSQVANINKFIAGLTGDGIVGFGAIHCDTENVTETLDRICALGLRGVKLHPIFQDFAMDDEKMTPIYTEIERRGLPILMHVGDRNSDASSPKRMGRLLDRFPRLTFIAAHLGGYSEWDDAERYVVGRRCYLDTSSAIRFLPPERSVRIIRAHGADRVLFGTDYPLSLHREELEIFDRLDLTETERELILWKNAYRLLGLDGAE